MILGTTVQVCAACDISGQCPICPFAQIDPHGCKHMPLRAPDLRRTWLFGPGADTVAHQAMLTSGADALIVDLEDFTPPNRRDEARSALAQYVHGCRERGYVAAVRINALESDGMIDLTAAMATKPDVMSATLFRLANFRSRYLADGGHASTCSSFR